MKKFVSALLLAGGTGSRFGSTLPKQFFPLGSKKIAHHSLDLFLDTPCIDEIIIVCDEAYREYFADYINDKIRFAKPGSTRQGSVYEGLQRISPESMFVCIHDSARPLLTKEELNTVIQQGIHYKAAVLAVPAKNTIKEVDKNGFVIKTLDRSLLWEMQTPQVLSVDLLQRGMAFAETQNLIATDDVSLAELIGEPVKIVPSSYRNIKITTQDDLAIANALYEEMYVQV